MNTASRVLLLGCLFSTTLQAAEVTGVDLKFISDSNPAKAQFERDIEESTAARLRVTGLLFDQALADDDSRRSGLSLDASASFEHNLDIEALGESRYRLALNWFRESRQSSGNPFVRLGLGFGHTDSQSERRDALVIDAGASVNFQVASFFDTTLGLQWVTTDAETEVFDTDKGTVFLTANLSPAPRWVLRSGLRFVMGNEVSTATPTLNIVNHADVIEPDEAFGGASAQRFAYLIDADSLVAEAGIGYAFSGTVTLDLLYRFVSTQGDGDIDYERNLLELTVGIDL